MATSLGTTAFVNPHSVNPHRASGDGLASEFTVLPPRGDTDPWPRTPVEIAPQILGAGTTMTYPEFLTATHTTSIAVTVGSTLVHEWYADGLGPDDLFLGASMSKSVLASLVGLAEAEGRLSMDDRIVDLVPELGDGGYAGSRVIDVLTMTSGVDWVEDHRDPDSLASRLVGSFRGGGDSRSMLGSIGSARPPGTRFEYCTADSQVLDWVRERATGEDYASALARLCELTGVRSRVAIGRDGSGVAFAGGAVAATTLDWARFGALGLDGGGVLTPRWADDCALPAYPFTAPGRLPSGITTHAGFSRHWWPMDTDGATVMADGSRGQFTYVNRRRGVVVVKTSQWPYDDWLLDRQLRDLSYLALPTIAVEAASLTG